MTIKELLVSVEDQDLLTNYSWHNGQGYARRSLPRVNGKQGVQFVHRVVAERMFGDITGKAIDHVSGNSLDNRRENIRIASMTQNQYNKGKTKNNTSGYKCVGFQGKSRTKPWIAYIGVDGKQQHLGLFKTAIEAAICYDSAARKYHGEFARFNFPKEGERQA